ncbi:PE family protein [Mycobacterium sp. Lab-001]|uniref:PE family protein n=1 Tax=Mycobacterium sp. Lab-001 TaxID=3410136 RepID=UPI003D17299B
MAFVSTMPEMVTAAAGDLAGIHAALDEAGAAAAVPTTGLAPAAVDEVSVAIAQLFDAYGREFHALTAAAGALHAEFVRLLNSGAAAYLDADTAGAGLLAAARVQTPTSNAYAQLWADTSANLQGIYHT